MRYFAEEVLRCGARLAMADAPLRVPLTSGRDLLRTRGYRTVEIEVVTMHLLRRSSSQSPQVVVELVSDQRRRRETQYIGEPRRGDEHTSRRDRTP